MRGCVCRRCGAAFLLGRLVSPPLPSLCMQAQAAAAWHLSRSHPLLVSDAAAATLLLCLTIVIFTMLPSVSYSAFPSQLFLAVDMASALALAGRPAAAASILSPVVEVVARSTGLGPRHQALGRAWMLVGHCHRSAAAAAHVWLRGRADGSSSVLGDVQSHAATHLNRAAHAYECALLLHQNLVKAAVAASPAAAAPPPPSPPAASTLRVQLANLPEASSGADVAKQVALAPQASCELLADAALCLADTLGMLGAGEPAALAAMHVRTAVQHWRVSPYSFLAHAHTRTCSNTHFSNGCRPTSCGAACNSGIIAATTWSRCCGRSSS
jgi:hypothetical protein